jgi:hypothetical protein
MKNLKPELKSLTTIHHALLIAEILILASFYFFGSFSKANIDTDLGKTLQIVVAGLTIGCVSIAFNLFNNKLTLLQRSELTSEEKFVQYRAASIVKYALLEGPCLFTIISYFLCRNFSFLFLAVTLVILFAAQTPTVAIMSNHLGVTAEDLYE